MKLRQIIVFRKLISVISRKTFNLGYRYETYVLSNGHETCQNYYGQIIMKHMTLVHSNGLELLSEYIAACKLEKL